MSEDNKKRKRVTIVIDDDIYKKLHQIQAKQIFQTKKSVSYSKVVNQELKKGVK